MQNVHEVGNKRPLLALEFVLRQGPFNTRNHEELLNGKLRAEVQAAEHDLTLIIISLDSGKE